MERWSNYVKFFHLFQKKLPPVQVRRLSAQARQWGSQIFDLQIFRDPQRSRDLPIEWDNLLCVVFPPWNMDFPTSSLRPDLRSLDLGDRSDRGLATCEVR